jgi:hypothetical protein
MVETFSLHCAVGGVAKFQKTKKLLSPKNKILHIIFQTIGQIGLNSRFFGGWSIIFMDRFSQWFRHNCSIHQQSNLFMKMFGVGSFF